MIKTIDNLTDEEWVELYLSTSTIVDGQMAKDLLRIMVSEEHLKTMVDIYFNKHKSTIEHVKSIINNAKGVQK